MIGFEKHLSDVSNTELIRYLAKRFETLVVSGCPNTNKKSKSVLTFIKGSELLGHVEKDIRNKIVDHKNKD